MPLLKKIGEMKKNGLQDDEISQKLREEGASPKEIDEALDQSRVKSAVGESAEPTESAMENTQGPPPPIYPEAALKQQTYREDTLEQYPQQYQNYPEYPRQNYEDYQYPAINTDMIMETAEQIIEEKTKEMQKQMTEFLKFKTEAQGKINNIDERIRRIESIIDRLQASILQKIGTYDKNITDLKKEMITTQESFSKVLNPLSEHLEELRKITDESEKKPSKKKSKTTRKKTTRKKQKDGDGFENYVRD